MRICKLQFKDYKRFHDLTIDLGDNPARIIALVGPNGCGKSSVFDGMLYKNTTQFTNLGINTAYTRDYKYHSLLKNPNYNSSCISIEFDEGSADEVIRKNSKTLMNTVFSFRSPYRYSSSLKVKDLHSVADIKLNNYGASTTSDMDSRIEENYRRLKIKYDNYMNSMDCKPSEAKKHILDELNNAISNCLFLKIDNLGNIEEGRGTLFFKKKDLDSTFEFNVLSAGEKEVVDILLDLYIRKDHYKNSIYIIDEPELHINTSIQKKLLLEINKMIPSECQIWVATHSIGFLRALQDELNNDSDVIYFDPDNNWASLSYVLKPITKSIKEWRTIFTTALDDLAVLVSPRTIVYCEGKDKPGNIGEEKGLDATVFNNIFGSHYPDVLFVSSGGNTELDQRSDIAIAVLSKALPATNILVLKDRDMASGKKTTEEDRQLYLKNNPDNHRVLSRFEIENYLYDKEVLKKYCLDNKLFFNEDYYDQFVTDICNQNLKDSTGEIKKICGLVVSINAEVFKKNLSEYIDCSMKVYKELEQVIFDRK